MKKILFFFLLLGIAISVFFLFWKNANAPVVEKVIVTTLDTIPQGKLSLETANTVSGMIEIIAPTLNALLQSPLTIIGRARGPWYFEASFPIELRDANNVLITTTVAQAQGDWMTENMVPFTATLTFPVQPTGSQGLLTFKNDNPSGEPQNSMTFDVPVNF